MKRVAQVSCNSEREKKATRLHGERVDSERRTSTPQPTEPDDMLERDVDCVALGQLYVNEHVHSEKELRLPTMDRACQEAEEGLKSLVCEFFMARLPEAPPDSHSNSSGTTTRRRGRLSDADVERVIPKVEYRVSVTSPLEPCASRGSSSGIDSVPKGGNGKKRTRSHGSRQTRDDNQPRRLFVRLVNNVVILTTNDVRTKDLRHSGLGWQGIGPERLTREAVIERYYDKTINRHIGLYFLPMPYDLKKKKVLLIFSKEKHLLLVRGTIAWFLVSLHGVLAEAIKLWFGDELSSESFAAKFQGRVRGDHAAFILGHWRQSMKEPRLIAFHLEREAFFQTFIDSPFMQHLIKHCKRMMDMHYPKVVERFQRSAAWHELHYKIKPLFGYFWNFCLNGIFSGMDRVDCAPHVDAKNPVAVCALYIYCLPGYDFRHEEKSWLVVWELGVVLELPPGVLVLYPSSLLFHWNVDITDIEFVRTVDGMPPRKETAKPLTDDGTRGRGSIVFFNQATMFQSSETGFGTMKLARQNGASVDGKYDEVTESQYNRSDMLELLPPFGGPN